MRIKYQPVHGGHRVVIPYFPEGPTTDEHGNPTAAAFRSWFAGDERDVPDDLRVPFNVSNNAFAQREGEVVSNSPGRTKTVRAVDALLSCGPMFVDAGTGKNPDFVCTVCGQETHDLYFNDPNKLASGMNVDADNPEADTRVWYTTDGTVNGDKLCSLDFLSQHPHYIRRHEQLERAQTHVLAEARRRSDDARVKAEQNRAQTAEASRTQAAPPPTGGTH